MCLSWGSAEELLVGHSALELYQTSSAPVCSWRKRLAAPVKIASLSYDSAYIASVSHHDPLVKVWRRLSYGPGDVRFDFIYLAHPQSVTGIQWRRPHHIDQSIDNVLFSFCSDGQLRVWIASDSHGQQLPNLWGKLDFRSSLKGRSNGSLTSKPGLGMAFMIQGRDFQAAILQAIQEADSNDGHDPSVLKTLITVANETPEICVVYDGRGLMSAWALGNIGNKRQGSQVNCIAQVTSSEFEIFSSQGLGPATHAEVYAYCNPGHSLYMLVHSFDGYIKVCRASIARLFDPNIKTSRLTIENTWAGHSAPVRKIVRNFSGRAIVSRTQSGESIVWTHTLGRDQTTLNRNVLVPHKAHIHRMCVLRGGRFVVFLQHTNILLWDCRLPVPILAHEQNYHIAGKPLCLLILPRQRADNITTAHIVTVTSEKQGIVWELSLPSPSRGSTSADFVPNGHTTASLREFSKFELSDAGNLAYVLPVDPAGSSPIVSRFLDVFAPDVAVSYTHSGRVEFWTARVDSEEGQVGWLSTSSMETGVQSPSLVSGSTMKKAALVNSSRSTLTIWDIRAARLEYTQDFEMTQTVQDLDWTSTPDSQSILAVGFPHKVVLMSQMRFDYLNKGPAWAAVREISMRELTPHSIGDSTWLGDGHLVIGAGNQLYVHDRQFDASSSLVTSLRLPQRKDGKWDLFEVVQRLNGPLPVFHPQFLSQCLLAGKLELVHRILLALHKTLKFWLQGETIDDYLGMGLEDFYTAPEVGIRRVIPSLIPI
jgi:hypothetical protein